MAHRKQVKDDCVWTCLRADTPPFPCCRTPSSPPQIKLNLTFIQESKETSYLCPLVRGVFFCFAWDCQYYPWTVVCVCVCVCVPSCLPAPSLSCAQDRRSFRDVLIKKQRWTSESHAGCRTRTVTQCRISLLSLWDGRTGLLCSQATWQPQTAPLKIKREFDAVFDAEEPDPKHHSHHPRMWTAAMVWPPQAGTPHSNRPPHTHESCHIISNVNRLLHPGCSTGATSQL